MQKTYWLEVIGCGLKADWGCIHCSSSIKTYPELSIIWPTVWLHIKQRSKGSPKKLGILTALVKQWHLSYAAQGPLWQSVTKITADGDCSHEIKRRLFLGRKVMTNLDRILKSRDITLPTKVHLVKAMVFLVVLYRYESWTIKEAEVLKNQCFWTVVLEKTLEGPLDS